MDNIFPTHADQLVVSLWSKLVLVVGIWFEVVSIERSATLWWPLRCLPLILAVGRAGSGDGSPSPIHQESASGLSQEKQPYPSTGKVIQISQEGKEAPCSYTNKSVHNQGI